MPLKPLKVSEVNRYIKRIITDDTILRNIMIEGEISNFKHHYSGHMYFTLKDKNSKIKCVMFKSYNQDINIQIQEGMNVIVSGYISVYESDGSYQLYATNIKQEGLGDLYKEFEKLKTKLKDEGLFDEINKKKLPFLPKNIGVVTSSTGAAIRDIITVIKRRMPTTNIFVYPVLVQGPKAHNEICNGLNYFESRDDIDLVITGRGGGSIEELWAFNEEDVARTIFSMNKPIISGVGHETDFTIADFVSDLRAPTPSAAGELAVPSKDSLEEKIDYLYNKLKKYSLDSVKIRKDRLESIRYESQLTTYPLELVNQKRISLDYLFKELIDKLTIYNKEKNNNLTNLVIKLDSLSPLKLLSRGYSLVSDENNHIIKSVINLLKDDTIKITLKDGDINAKVTDIFLNNTIEGDNYE